MDKLKMETNNLTERNIEKIAELFPNVITEIKDENGKLRRGINFGLLKQELIEDVIDGEECYEFTWVGKKAAIVASNTPIRKTLRPCIEESKDWENTENLYIEGDNLDVLKLLQESYLNSIKMIYIDPPYNTGSDLLYRDNFDIDKEQYEEQIGLFDEDYNMMFKNTDRNGRFHSDWCSMMYPRLKLALNLLREDGVIFISIDDNEVDNLKKICDELFGENNKVAEFVVIRSEGGGMAKQVIKGHDYLIVYAKNINNFTPLGKPKDIRGTIIEKDGEKYWIQEDWLRKEFGKYGNCHYEEIIEYKGEAKKKEIDEGLRKGLYVLIPKSNGLNIVGKLRNLKEDSSKFYSILKHLSAEGIKDLKEIELDDYFDYPKPVSLIKEAVSGATFFTAKESDIIMDFFSGSSTTAHAVMQLNAEDCGNRKFIMVQLPEKTDEKSEAYKAGYKNICEIGKERIRRAGEKIKYEIEEYNKNLKEGEEPKIVPDIGFRVLKVDSSNMKDVYYSATEYTQEKIGNLISNIKEDRTDLDLLYGVMLEWNLYLSLRHKIEKIEGVNVHIVDKGSLVACFENKVSETVIREIAKLKPLRVVFRDSSFESSPDKINVTEIFKLISPNTSIKVI